MSFNGKAKLLPRSSLSTARTAPILVLLYVFGVLHGCVAQGLGPHHADDRPRRDAISVTNRRLQVTNTRISEVARFLELFTEEELEAQAAAAEAAASEAAAAAAARAAAAAAEQPPIDPSPPPLPIAPTPIPFPEGAAVLYTPVAGELLGRPDDEPPVLVGGTNPPSPAAQEKEESPAAAQEEEEESPAAAQEVAGGKAESELPAGDSSSEVQGAAEDDGEGDSQEVDQEAEARLAAEREAEKEWNIPEELVISHGLRNSNSTAAAGGKSGGKKKKPPKKKLSIVLVGNGKSLSRSKKGAAIDAHDMVGRFNFFKIKGYERDVGTKTNLWFLGELKGPGPKGNRGSSGQTGSMDLHIKPDKYIVPIVYPTPKGCGKRQPHKCKMDSKGEKHRRHTEGILKRLYGKYGLESKLEIMPMSVEQRLQTKWGYTATWPSSGLLSIVYVLDKYPNADISIVGFDFLKKSLGHYWENVRKKRTLHSMGAEGNFIRFLIRQKMLKVL